MSLHPTKLGLAGGILWGLSMFVLTLVSVGTGYAAGFFNGMASIYPGYSVSPIGSIIGLVYGFLDAFIGLFLFAWLYNWLLKR